MVRLKLIVCSSYSVRDADSNGISVFNILDGLSANGFPLFIQNFAVTAILERDAADDPNREGRFEIKLGEKVLAATNAHVNFADKMRARQLLKVNGLVVPGPGTLEVIFVSGDIKGTWSIEVERMTPADIQALGIPAEPAQMSLHQPKPPLEAGIEAAAEPSNEET